MGITTSFLYSGFDFSKNEKRLKSKFKMLNQFLLISAFFTFLFAIMSELEINELGYIHTKVDFICSFLSILLVFLLRSSKENFFRVSLAFIIILYFTFISALVNVLHDELRLVWFYLLIYVTFSLLNISIGFIVTALSIGAILLSHLYIDLQLSSFSIYSAILGLIIVSLVFKVHLTEIEEYENDLQDAFDSLQESNNEIENLNQNLELKVKKEVEKNNELTNKRLHEMGKTVSMIAHQWRQPLNAISLIIQKLDIYYQKNILTDESMKTSVEKVLDIINTMSLTIDDFRYFYKTDKKFEEVKLSDVVTSALVTIEGSLETTKITLQTQINDNETIKVCENEIMQVILNILVNSIDNFSEKQIKNPYIKIITSNGGILICDNGGGIPADIIGKIFDPYFSTKGKKNGSGLGLYMSKMIIEDHHQGRLEVYNTEEGACFRIEF